jgi:hypothetical protein
MLLIYQVATTLSLTTCWQVVELQDDNKSVELNNLVARSQQAVDNLSTSWELEQHCYKSAAGSLIRILYDRVSLSWKI